MTITDEFEYFKPKNIDETLNLLTKYKNSAILAGGTDLICNLKEGIITPEVVIDIKGLNGLKEIELKNNKLLVGALITFTELMESDVVREKFPLIYETSKTVGSVAIRNRATMVGNICSAVPSLDSGPLLYVYEAKILVKSTMGEREVSILDWFMGPKQTSLKAGEFVIGISIPLPVKKHAGCYVRLGRYAGEDLAQVCLSIIALADDSYRVAFGAVAPVPVRARKIEAILNGKKIDKPLIEKAKEIIPEEISPITDIRASKEYRLHTAKVMFERGIRVAIQRLKGTGPEYGISVI